MVRKLQREGSLDRQGWLTEAGGRQSTAVPIKRTLTSMTVSLSQKLITQESWLFQWADRIPKALSCKEATVALH